MLLWFWCGLQWARLGKPPPAPELAAPKEEEADVILVPLAGTLAPQFVQLEADVGRRHQRFADQHRLHAGTL